MCSAPENERKGVSEMDKPISDRLVKAGVLADDNCTIAATHDGSHVVLGDKHPRVEIEIRGD